jgi:hypothetical protein
MVVHAQLHSKGWFCACPLCCHPWYLHGWQRTDDVRSGRHTSCWYGCCPRCRRACGNNASFKTLDGLCCPSVGSGSAAATAKVAAIVAAATIEATATAAAATVAAAAAVAAAATIVASAAAAVIASATTVDIPMEDLGAATARYAATASLALSAATGRARTLLLVIGHHVGGGDGIQAPGRASTSAPAWH